MVKFVSKKILFHDKRMLKTPIRGPRGPLRFTPLVKFLWFQLMIVLVHNATGSCFLSNRAMLGRRVRKRKINLHSTAQQRRLLFRAEPRLTTLMEQPELPQLPITAVQGAHARANLGLVHTKKAQIELQLQDLVGGICPQLDEQKTNG